MSDPFLYRKASPGTDGARRLLLSSSQKARVAAFQWRMAPLQDLVTRPRILGVRYKYTSGTCSRSAPLPGPESGSPSTTGFGLSPEAGAAAGLWLLLSCGCSHVHRSGPCCCPPCLWELWKATTWNLLYHWSVDLLPKNRHLIDSKMFKCSPWRVGVVDSDVYYLDSDPSFSTYLLCELGKIFHISYL